MWEHINWCNIRKSVVRIGQDIVQISSESCRITAYINDFFRTELQYLRKSSWVHPITWWINNKGNI